MFISQDKPIIVDHFTIKVAGNKYNCRIKHWSWYDYSFRSTV